MSEEDETFTNRDDFVLGEVRQLRYDMSALRQDVGKLMGTDEKLDLHNRVTHLERFRWAMPATAVLAIVIAIIGGLA